MVEVYYYALFSDRKDWRIYPKYTEVFQRITLQSSTDRYGIYFPEFLSKHQTFTFNSEVLQSENYTMLILINNVYTKNDCIFRPK